MFRKIVSNLSFSPALAHQLGFYAKRLRKEELTRRLGLIFVALALVVQSLTVFVPSDSANAANANDLVYGGIRPADGGLSLFFRTYDPNTNGLRNIMDYFGITRAEIAAAQHGAFTNSSVIRSLHSVNNRQQGSAGERSLTTTNTNTGQPMTFFTRPLYRADNQVTTIWGFKGYSAQLQAKTGKGTFYLMDQCGNLLIETVPLPPPPPPPPPKPVPTSSCSSLVGKIVSRKQFELTASSSTMYGATVSQYDFTVKNTAGATVFNKVVKTTQLSAGSGTFTLSDPGTYTAKVDVTTSIGVKTSVNCITKLTVAPPDKCPVNQNLSAEDKDCQPCPNKPTLWIKDADCAPPRCPYNTNILANDKECLPCANKPALWIKDPLCLTVIPPSKCVFNTSLLATDKDCQPCPNTTIWFKDPACAAKVIRTKTATNLSQGSVDATSVTAQATDQIRYSITVENTGLASEVVKLDEQLDDVLEYATIIDNGGGTFDATSKTLSWPSITLKAGEKQVRVFTVRILNDIPATAKGASESTSYDCKIFNVFGNVVTINVACPTPKIVENVVTQLPTTGPTENMIFAGIVVAIVTYFYLRARQVNKEVRLIRRHLNTGTI